VIDQARWVWTTTCTSSISPAPARVTPRRSNTAAEIAVVEWDAAAYFAHQPSLSLTLLNQNPDALPDFPSQLGWE